MSSLLVCPNASGPRWRLGNVSAACRQVVLIGWVKSRRVSGVPDPVGWALARACTAVARVTFASSEMRDLVETLRADVARRLFEDPSYPWWMQGQAAILSSSEAPAPAIDRTMFEGLVSDDWVESALAYAGAGITGILRPGVGGDVAGLFMLSRVLESELLAALEREARVVGLGWSVLDEAAFADALGA